MMRTRLCVIGSRMGFSFTFYCFRITTTTNNKGMKTATTSTTLLVVALAVLFLSTTASTAFSGNGMNRDAAPITAKGTTETMSRTAFVAGITGSLLIMTPAKALAKATSPVVDKTLCDCEKEQNVEICKDLCMYECTKHGGTLADCKVDCARQCKTVRGQRTMATPITEKGVDYK